MIPSRLIIIALLLCHYALFAQNSLSKDTLETARQLSYQKKYPEAVQLLETFEIQNPDNINAVRLHVQILYWMKAFNQLSDISEHFLQKHPDNQYLQLDYGRILFELQEFSKAKALINKYLKVDPNHVEALNMLGSIAFWQGQPRLASAYFQKVLKQYPGNEWALKMKGEIESASAPYLQWKSGYTNDSQPLDQISTDLSAGWYHSSLLSPTFLFQNQLFQINNSWENANTVLIGNQISFSSISLKGYLNLGVFNTPPASGLGFTGRAGVEKKIMNHLYWSVSAGRQPYLYTLSSLKQPVAYNDFNTSLNYSQDNGWSGSMGYLYQAFDDQNAIQSANAWVLSPTLRAGSFSAQFGYSFQYSDARENRFAADKTVADIIAGYAGDSLITGSYQPYFTPSNQQIHAILCNLSYSPWQKISVYVNANIGVYATAGNPYLFLNKNANEEVFVDRQYVDIQFHPMAIHGKITYTASPKILLEAGFEYQKAFYYTHRSAQLGLKYTFLHAPSR